MAEDKSAALSEGESALKDLPSVKRTSYEGGDGGEDDRQWHNTYRVWPVDNHGKHDVARDCEDHFAENYVLSPSMTDDEHDFLYVTVRTY